MPHIRRNHKMGCLYDPERKYRDDITIEEGLRLTLRALNKVLDKGFSVERIDAAYITTTEKKFTKLKRDKLDKLLKEIKKAK